jgi:nicotinamide-nucleotide amidase
VAYHPDAKYDILGVSKGPVVSERAAREMTRGAAQLFGADITVAVTGAGGPDGQDGEPPGTVWCAVRSPTSEVAVLNRFEGEPATICEQACARALALVEACFFPEEGRLA